MSSSAASTFELERTYDVTSDLELPELSTDPGVHVDRTQQHLVATYFDTVDLRLRGAKITLRHRSGDDVAGWHLKLPAGAGREELQLPGQADDSVPAELRGLTRSVTRGAPLLPIARLTTERQVHRLVDGDGRLLVEVVDDRVEGQLLDEAASAPLRWREWEAELGGATEALLDEIGGRLLAAGATPSDAASKVGRVLATRPAPDGQSPWWTSTGPVASRASAGSVVQLHLRGQVDELVRRDPHVRREVPDAVHKMRVATRRLRSALSTFRPLLDRGVTDPVRDELSWLADVLGAVRDAEVMRVRVLQMIEAEPPDLVLGPVRRRVDAVLGRRHRLAQAAAIRALDSERYVLLLDRLEALVTDPPFDDAARECADDVLPPLVRRAWKHLDASMHDAEHAADAAAQDQLLHAARKRAKAARYAAESVAEVFGKPAKRLAAAMEELQEVLGEHQDGVVTREVLRELGAGASRSGENGFTFGRLHALEQARADAAVVRWPAVRKAASKPSLRRWLG